MAAQSICLTRVTSLSSLEWKSGTRKSHKNNSQVQLPLGSRIRASQSTDDKNKAHRQLGLFALKRKIEDAILHAESLALAALELEETKRIQQEQMIREYNLWDDPVKSNEILAKLADSAKLVDALKDLRYKAEEAKLITQLAEVDAIDYGFFEQAYAASLDMKKFLRQYETSKLLTGPYDKEGACITIEAGSECNHHELWAGQLLTMYTKWAEIQGYKGRVVEKHLSPCGGIKYATLEFEFEHAYGILFGEKGIHRMMNSSRSAVQEVSIAAVDVIPLFLTTACDLHIDDEDLTISSPLSHRDKQGKCRAAVTIQHIPTGISFQSSGERSYFANKMKAINRLTAKLLVIGKERGVSSVNSITRDTISDIWQIETRSYANYPDKVVKDVKTGVQLHDLTSVLDGYIDPLLGAHINSRQL